MKYKPEIVDKLLESLRKGNGRFASCKIAGICYDTLLDWINPDSPRFKSDFSESLKKAEQDGINYDEEQYKGVIKKAAAEGAWQAAAWMLERKHGYSAKVNNEVSGQLRIKVDPFEQIRKNAGIDDTDN
jgi:hypothetical protein